MREKVESLESEVEELEKARERFRNLTLDQKQEIKKLKMKLEKKE
jgi:hypothetical protein